MINNTNTSKPRENSAAPEQNYNSGAAEFTLGLDVFVLLIVTEL
jgi:hypothetical protein